MKIAWQTNEMLKVLSSTETKSCEIETQLSSNSLRSVCSWTSHIIVVKIQYRIQRFSSEVKNIICVVTHNVYEGQGASLLVFDVW